MTRFILAFLFLALAFVMQFWFASLGMYINFIFAALIAFSYLFDLWDLIFFILLAVFVINWQPAWSIELTVIALVPLVGYAVHKYSWWEPWVANLGTIFLGLLALYIAAAPRLFLSEWRTFALDLVTCFIFGSIIFGALNRRERPR